MVTVASDKLNPDQQMTQIDPATGANRSIMPVLTMNTYLGQLKSEAMMKRVITRLNLSNHNIADMSGMINAGIVKDSNLIEVKVLNNDPNLAFKIANTLSEEYLSLTREFMFSSVVVISPANIPIQPVKPNKMLNIILAFILGLILSSLLSYFLESMDNTVKTVGDVNHELNLPVLGLIPVQNRRNSKQRSYGG
jgi:capsular polysaccharide biosynthesis protein